MAREPDLNTVLGKVLAILTCFTAEDGEVTLAELVGRTGVPKPSVHRIAGELVEAELLERTGGGYRLGAGLFELGLRARAQRGLLEVAMPFMQDVFVRTGEVVNLGVLDGDRVGYIAKIGGHRQVRVPTRTGGRMPLHCTGLGKALLAHADPALRDRVLTGPLERLTARTVTAPGLLRRQLRRVVTSGVAFEHEEAVNGVVCVAAPILDADRRLVAAISLTGSSSRFRPEQHAGLVRDAAGGIALTYARDLRAW